VRTDSNLASVRWHAGALNNGLIFGATYHGVRHLPRACSYAIGHVGTWLAYRLMREGTRALVENLRVVRPNAADAELRRLALLTYRTYARDTIDFIRGLGMTRDELRPMMAEFDTTTLDMLRKDARGVILAGGHFGNWELGGVVLRVLHGYEVTVIGKPESSLVVGRFRRHMRDSLGIETLEIGLMLETALQIRRRLADGRLVAMLLDRYIGRDRIDVTFFGRTTPFLRTPAMIGYLSGAPLLPAFMTRQPDGRFVGAFGDPIVVDSSRPTEESVRASTQAFAAQLEERIRENPHLWYQFYRYWDSESASRRP
jgi:lauroyl/myristoyl acyltransferase